MNKLIIKFTILSFLFVLSCGFMQSNTYKEINSCINVDELADIESENKDFCTTPLLAPQIIYDKSEKIFTVINPNKNGIIQVSVDMITWGIYGKPIDREKLKTRYIHARIYLEETNEYSDTETLYATDSKSNAIIVFMVIFVFSAYMAKISLDKR